MHQDMPRGLRAIRGRNGLFPKSTVGWCRCHLGWAANAADRGCASAGRTKCHQIRQGVGIQCISKGHLYERGKGARRFRKLGTGVRVRLAAGLRRLHPTLLPGHRGRHRGRRGAGCLRTGFRPGVLWGPPKMTRRQSKAGAVGEVAGRGRRATHTAGGDRPPIQNCNGRSYRPARQEHRSPRSPGRRRCANRTQCTRRSAWAL